MKINEEIRMAEEQQTTAKENGDHIDKDVTETKGSEASPLRSLKKLDTPNESETEEREPRKKFVVSPNHERQFKQQI